MWWSALIQQAHLLIGQDQLELVQGEVTVVARVGGVEEVQQLVGVTLLLLNLLLHCCLRLCAL